MKFLSLLLASLLLPALLLAQQPRHSQKRSTKRTHIRRRHTKRLQTSAIVIAPNPRGAAVTTAMMPTARADPRQRPRTLTDEQLLDLVQRQTFRYFWDFGHPVSGMARERSNVAYDYGHEVVTTGGTGFGIMAIIVAAEHKWITRAQAAARVNKIVNFLWKADMYHGAFPHWLNGETGHTIRFSLKDDGADIVETSFLYEGLLCARQYFTGETADEKNLRNKINWMWDGVEWNWFTQGGQKVLYWHWSPNNDWSMNHQLHGWNEALITYVLAAASERYGIEKVAYDKGWATGKDFNNSRQYYNNTLPLGPELGGPLFFTHYSFMGLDPHGLKDHYTDYWIQNRNHTLINRAYCLANPKQQKGYGPACWGLTASDSWQGYAAHSPTEDPRRDFAHGGALSYALHARLFDAGAATLLQQLGRQDLGRIRLCGCVQRAAQLVRQVLLGHRPRAYYCDDRKPALGPDLEAVYERARGAARTQEAGVRESVFQIRSRFNPSYALPVGFAPTVHASPGAIYTASAHLLQSAQPRLRLHALPGVLNGGAAPRHGRPSYYAV
jgi:hypothetical protein